MSTIDTNMERIKLMNLKMLNLVERDSLRNVLFDKKVESINTVLGYKQVNSV